MKGNGVLLATIVAVVIFAVLLMVVLQNVYDQLEECQEYRTEEANNWQDIEIKRIDQITKYKNELKLMRRDWHPAHISPHTKEACAGYACGRIDKPYNND